MKKIVLKKNLFDFNVSIILIDEEIKKILNSTKGVLSDNLCD